MDSRDKKVNYQEPKPLYVTEEKLYEYGEKSAIKFGYDYEICQDLDNLVNDMGGEIEYVDRDLYNETEQGSIEVLGKNNNPKFKIYISRFTGPLKDRFTIAHELGHYVLHSRLGEIPIRVARYGSGQCEYEANCFAVGFLMPSAHFKKAMMEKTSIEGLAGEYNVSTYVANLRVQRIKRIAQHKDTRYKSNLALTV